MAIGVLYGKYAGSGIKLDGKDYLIVRESDLLEFLDTHSAIGKSAINKDCWCFLKF